MPLTTPEDSKYGAQYVLVNSFGFLTDRRSPVLIAGLKPAPLPHEFLSFRVFYVVTDGLELGHCSSLTKLSPCSGKGSNSSHEWGYWAANCCLNVVFGGERTGQNRRVLTEGRYRVRRLHDFAFHDLDRDFAGRATSCIVRVRTIGF